MWGHWRILQVKRFDKSTEFGEAWTFGCWVEEKEIGLVFLSQPFDPRTHAVLRPSHLPLECTL